MSVHPHGSADLSLSPLPAATRVSPHIRLEANIANLEANIFKQNSELKG